MKPQSSPPRPPRTKKPSCEKSSIVATLQKKYGKRLARAAQELKADEKLWGRAEAGISDLKMFWKWSYRVGAGWYGFSLGHIPPVWLDLLDEFLVWLEAQCPDFEIHQIKIKINGLRFYVGTKTSFVIPDEKIRAEISKLEKLLRFPLPPEPRASVCRVRKKHRTPSAKP